MTRDQMSKERDRLQALLHAHQVTDPRGSRDAEEVPCPVDPSRFEGLKRRIEELTKKLEGPLSSF